MGAILGNATNPKMKKRGFTKMVWAFLAFKGLWVLFFEGPGGNVGAVLGMPRTQK